MRQADVFLNSEGNAWLERNRDKLGKPDPVTPVIAKWVPRPRRVLEVGCADGRRLADLRDMYGCEVFGVEPSLQAGIEAAARRVPVVQCSAASLAVQGPFDLVIYGFCLYLTDPDDWLRIAAEGDAVLADDGHLIIHDFLDEEGVPIARRYEHRDGLWSYHYNFCRLWIGHQRYQTVFHQKGTDDAITILRKRPLKETFKVMP